MSLRNQKWGILKYLSAEISSKTTKLLRFFEYERKNIEHE